MALITPEPGAVSDPTFAKRLRPAGIRIRGIDATEVDSARENFWATLRALGMDRHVCVEDEAFGGNYSVSFRLDEHCTGAWAADSDTTQIHSRIGLDSARDPSDLEREILLAMLVAPVALEFPSFGELAAAVRMRKNIVAAARNTQLAFHTREAERPEDYWTYVEGRGFLVHPGRPLIEALRKATQPDASEKLYSFSCYRATEYVILLGIAAELTRTNPALLDRLQTQWERRAIMSAEFHDVFLREYGSMSAPLPARYYVPGDRLWFRNPDRRSADVEGYEGSWVFYLGQGLFTNFWKRNRPFTLTSKCVEIFHWRHGAYWDDATGEMRMDESIVEEHVAESLADPTAVSRILGTMMRLRDPQGIYAHGGCIDASREMPRWICPGTADLDLPIHHPVGAGAAA